MRHIDSGRVLSLEQSINNVASSGKFFVAVKLRRAANLWNCINGSFSPWSLMLSTSCQMDDHDLMIRLPFGIEANNFTC